MANVGDSPNDRGQLILVTGLLVAVTMVSLVLLLNTAIYTENLASRGLDQSGREAVEFRGVLQDEVGNLIVAENERELGGWSTVQETTRDGILKLDNRTARAYAATGTVVAVNRSTMAFNEGKLIRQTDGNRELTGASGTSDWDVAQSIEGTRRFRMTVTGNLNSTNESRAFSENAFRIQADDGSNTWYALIYSNQTTGEITLATKVGAADTTEHCTLSGSDAAINFSDGMMNGSLCNGYQWAEGISPPYDIRFINGGNGTGTYRLTVDDASSSYPDLNTGGTSPYRVPAVYSSTFDVYFETPTLRYRAPVRVAPGEPP